MPSGDNFVKSGQVLSFKTGTQAAVDQILAAGSGAVHGAFYLTQDSHRLYVGNEDTSLSPVNEGVTTIANMTALAAITPSGADARKALTGRFYYLSDENILCVYNGSSWIRINQNTNDVINTYTYTADTTNNLIQGTIRDTGNHQVEARFKVVNGDGVSVSYGTTNVTINNETYAVPTITINADYEIGVVTENSETKVKLTSTSGGSTNDSSFTVAPGNYTGELASNVTIANDNGTLKIAAKDTKITGVSATNNSTAGFDITLSDNHNTSGLTTNFQPKITYGNIPTTVDFVNGTATLNVYTKGEVDDVMKSLNAMHYVGTFGQLSNDPSGASDIDYDTTPGEVHVFLDAEELDVHIGDTFLVQESRAIGPSGNRKTLYKGDLLIARSSDGTEDANGVIDPSKLTFDIVQSTYDTDTKYRFIADDDNQGIKLVSYNVTSTQTTGALLFTGGTIASDADGTTTNDMIKVTKSYTDVQGSGKQCNITIKHKDVARTNTNGTAVTMATSAPSSTNNWRNTKSISVITGVTTNESGHITGVETTSLTISDTNSYFGANAAVVTTSTYSGTSSKKVGIIKTETTLTNPGNSTSKATAYTAITSQSLSINDDDTQMTESGGSQAASGLNIEILWGSF